MRQPTRKDVYYENGQIKDKGHNPDAEPLPEYEVPPALKSGAYIDELAGDGSDHVLNKAQTTYQTAHRRWKALEDLRETQDPRDTRAAHLERLHSVANTNRQNTFKAIDNSRKEVTQAAKKVEQEALGSMGLAVDRIGAAEVRSAFKGLSEAERREYVSQAIAEQDTALLSAVINAPHAVSVGLKNQAELEAVRERILGTLCPGAKQRRDAYKKAHDRLLSLTEAWLENEDNLTCRELREQYQKKSDKAAEAGKAVEEGMRW